MDNEKILEALFQPVISTEETKPEDDDCSIVCCDPDDYDDYGNEYDDEYEDEESEYSAFDNSTRINMLRDLSNTILDMARCLEDYDHGYSDDQYTNICERMDSLKQEIERLDSEVRDYYYIG